LFDLFFNYSGAIGDKAPAKAEVWGWVKHQNEILIRMVGDLFFNYSGAIGDKAPAKAGVWGWVKHPK